MKRKTNELRRNQSTNKPARGRPKKSATAIGIQKTAKIATTKIIKDTTNSVRHPLARIVLVAALGALASYFIYKK